MAKSQDRNPNKKRKTEFIWENEREFESFEYLTFR